MKGSWWHHNILQVYNKWVWICCVYQWIARVESKGTHRSKNLFTQRSGYGGGERERERREYSNRKHTRVQNRHLKVNSVIGMMYITKADLCTKLQWLFISTWWQNALLRCSKGHGALWNSRGLSWGKKTPHSSTAQEAMRKTKPNLTLDRIIALSSVCIVHSSNGERTSLVKESETEGENMQAPLLYSVVSTIQTS